MSKMIPEETIAVLREFNDISVDIYGINCTLYVPKTEALNLMEDQGVYGTISEIDDVGYKAYNTLVFIEWSPDTRKLRKLGLYMERDVPIIGWFKNIPEISIESYIKVPLNYAPQKYGTDEFDIVDILIKHMHDADVLHAYRLAPRRNKKVEE